MKKAMFSQPMSGLSEEQIVEARNKAVKFFGENDFELVNILVL